MCTLQLHHVVAQHKSINRVPIRSECFSHRYGSHLIASHRSTQRSPRITSKNAKVQIGWCIPFVNFQQKARSNGGFVFAYASAIPLPYKEIVQSAKSLASSLCTILINAVHENRVVQQCVPAVGLIIFALWGLGPILQFIHRAILHEEGRSWKGSQLNHMTRMYVRPFLLWIGVVLICRAFDPIVLSTEASQAIKQRFVNFVRSLSTVLAFAYCTSSVIQQLHKVMLDRHDTQDSRSLGAQFVGNAVYTAVWVAALCLFMELLGFSTQKWLTAGGVGTLLLTLAGREIFTNFLSSIMIHATQPFVLNEWIQTKIDGYEVSGTVEHVGWWSPTIVRAEDREAVHIPNHKFTVSVVRNLTQKSHWRIKTYFGISHLDVSKISSIVADMRKVLAKHPQVEQKRLHRRIFFESVNLENQALMVLVSCFVKTPHFEEYLNVKEVILLDLMKVISYHNARLATPIRSVQRVLDDIEPRANRNAETQAKPDLLIEMSSVANVYRDTEQSGSSKNGSTQAKDNVINSDGTGENENSTGLAANTRSGTQLRGMLINEGNPKNDNLSEPAEGKIVGKQKSQLEGLDSMGLNSNDITLLGAAYEKPPAKIPEDPVDSRMHGDQFKLTPDIQSGGDENKSSIMTAEHVSQLTGTKSHKLEKNLDKIAKDTDVGSISLKVENNNNGGKLKETDLSMHQRTDAGQKSEMHRAQVTSGDVDRGISGTHSVSNKTQLEENLVLGVALNGPKQTLPLDNKMIHSMEHKELVMSSNGNSGSAGKDGHPGSQSSNTSSTES